MDENTNQKIEETNINPNNDDNRKSNTFNLVIGIATLLIALLGATFAYFSATARSAENDVTVKSAYVSISYDGGTEIKATNLIPATLNVALTKYIKSMDEFTPTEENPIKDDYDYYTAPDNDYSRRCVDALGREVCYVYQFSIESDGAQGETTDILASLKVNKNEFDNLSYVLYEVSLATREDGTPLIDKYGINIVNPGSYQLRSNFSKIDTNPDFETSDFTDVRFEKFEKPVDEYGENEELINSVKPVACLFGYSEDYESKALDDTSRCASYTLTNKEKHTYQLVIWLEETGRVQPEQGMTFEGTVAIVETY